MSLTLNREDRRLKSLLEWIEFPVTKVEPVAGDASRRRYFRVFIPDGQLIAMDAPPPEDVNRFAKVATLMRRVGVKVPEIYALESAMGFALLEDFGDRSYLSCLEETNADRLYGQALNTTRLLQTTLEADQLDLPSYSEDLLNRELGIFLEWLLDRWLGVVPDDRLWQRTIQVLVENALEQPQVCVHRDYHSRNLMVMGGESPGVLDFQDAVIGPVTYDPVSLLRDCYVSWPDQWVERWSERYRQSLVQAGMSVGPQHWQRWFDLMGAQRHLKAAGIFVRLWLREGRRGYLGDIPLTLGYVVAVCARHDPLRPFGKFLREVVMPQVREKL